jgi:hypothetical protein
MERLLSKTLCDRKLLKNEVVKLHRCTVAHVGSPVNSRSTDRDTPDALDREAIGNDTAMQPNQD